MKNYFSLMQLLFAVLITHTLSGQINFEFDHNGQVRNYIYYAPANLPANAPLVFVLHGYTSNANNIMSYSEMNQEANDSGFAVCYPQGLQDNFGIPHWNANLTISNVDDIGFLSALAIYLQNEYNLDAGRTFACGMSNGGFMSYTLACEKPDVFKAIASVTGTMSGYDWENCNPDSVVPVMQISGTDDNTVPIDGSITTFGGWGGAPGMTAVRDFWVDLNACQGSTDLMINADYSTVKTIYFDGTEGQEVWHYLIEGWGHNWPTSFSGTAISAAKHIWNFFSLVDGEETTSLVNLDKDPTDINVYPNPSRGLLNISVEGLRSKNYSVYSLDGLKHHTGIIDLNNMIDLSHLESGMYILNVDGVSTRIAIME